MYGVNEGIYINLRDTRYAMTEEDKWKNQIADLLRVLTKNGYSVKLECEEDVVSIQYCYDSRNGGTRLEFLEEDEFDLIESNRITNEE